MRWITARSTGSSWRARRDVANFDKSLKRSGAPSLVNRFGEETAAVMRTEMLDEYRRLLPEVPYIGGRRNPCTSDLKGTPAFLAVHRVILRHGGNVEDTGWVLHSFVRAEIERVPAVIRHWMGRHRIMGRSLRKWKKAARWTQGRRYPDDWVMEIVDSDGESFDLGVDITECGILKYLQAHEAGELTPYFCDGDYVVAEMVRTGLQRTKTLAWGCDRCDFRFVRDGTTTAAWPPRLAERTCGQPDTAKPEATSAQ